MYRSNLSLMAWFYAMLLFANSSTGMRGSFLRRQLGLGLRSSARLSNRIRLHMAACERPEQLGGPGKTVYVDETLVRYGVLPDQSRPSAVIVMGLACEGQVLSGIIPDRRRTTVLPVIQRLVRPGSTIVTDGHASYKRLARAGWRHKVVNHSVWFSDFAGTDMNDIETYWRVLKRTFSSYRRINFDNLWLYLAEVEFRYNLRRSPIGVFEHLIGQFPIVGNDEAGAINARYCW